MWKISSEAMTYLSKEAIRELTVDQPLTVSGCCIQISEPPKVRVGANLRSESGSGIRGDGGRYVALEVEGIKLNIPTYLTGLELTIDLTRFFHREKLVIEGWNLV